MLTERCTYDHVDNSAVKGKVLFETNYFVKKDDKVKSELTSKDKLKLVTWGKSGERFSGRGTCLSENTEG